MDHVEFATKVKAKHPEYSDMSDADLTRAMMRKFPEYSDVDTSKMDIQAPLPEATDADTVEGGVVFMNPTTPEKAKAYTDREVGISDVPAITKDAIVDYFNKFKSGPFNEESAPARAWAEDHPGSVAAAIAAPALPAAGVAGALIAGGTSMAGNAVDQGVAKYRNNTPFDVEELLASGAAGTMIPGAASAGGALIKRILGPMATRIEQYPMVKSIWENQNKLGQEAATENQIQARSILSTAQERVNELRGNASEQVMLGDLPSNLPYNDPTRNAELRASLYHHTAADELEDQLKLEAIKGHMFIHDPLPKTHYENFAGPDDFVEPTNREAMDYLANLQKDYIPTSQPAAPKGINFLGQYAGDEEALLSPRTWANKAVNSDSKTLRFLGNSFVDNKYIPRLAIRAANAAPDAAKVAIPFASAYPNATLMAGTDAIGGAGTYLMNRVRGKKSE